MVAAGTLRERDLQGLNINTYRKHLPGALQGDFQSPHDDAALRLGALGSPRPSPSLPPGKSTNPALLPPSQTCVATRSPRAGAWPEVTRGQAGPRAHCSPRTRTTCGSTGESRAGPAPGPATPAPPGARAGARPGCVRCDCPARALRPTPASAIAAAGPTGI